MQRVLALEEGPLSDETFSQDLDEIGSLFSHIVTTIELLMPPPEPSNSISMLCRFAFLVLARISYLYQMLS